MSYSLRDAASELVSHVTTDLEAATERAVSRLSYEDLRHATAQYLMQNARSQWRTLQAAKEQDATAETVTARKAEPVTAPARPTVNPFTPPLVAREQAPLARPAAAQEADRRRYEDRRRRVSEAQQERSRQVYEDMQQAMVKFEQSIVVKWERKLLDSGFALPDGTLTNWGDATIAQHRRRIEMLNGQAAASTENAARHLKAVNTITEAGVATLREAVLSLSRPEAAS